MWFWFWFDGPLGGAGCDCGCVCFFLGSRGLWPVSGSFWCGSVVVVFGFCGIFFLFCCDQCLKEDVGIAELGMGLIWMVAKFYLCSFFLCEYG